MAGNSEACGGKPATITLASTSLSRELKETLTTSTLELNFGRNSSKLTQKVQDRASNTMLPQRNLPGNSTL